MRKSEKEFLRHVKDEATLLHEVAEKTSLSYENAYEFAIYLNKKGLIRLNYFILDGTKVFVVSKPIEIISRAVVYTNVIAVSCVVLGSLLNWLLSESHNELPIILPKIQIVHDTVQSIIHDTIHLK